MCMALFDRNETSKFQTLRASPPQLGLALLRLMRVTGGVFQHYIELSSHYERPRPPASSDSELCDAAYDRPRAASVPVARQQSTESGVFMSRPSSDTSPARSARRPSADVTTHLQPVAARRHSDAGYLLPTMQCVHTTPAACHSVATASDSDLCGSVESDVFEVDTLLPQ